MAGFVQQRFLEARFVLGHLLKTAISCLELGQEVRIDHRDGADHCPPEAWARTGALSARRCCGAMAIPLLLRLLGRLLATPPNCRRPGPMPNTTALLLGGLTGFESGAWVRGAGRALSGWVSPAPASNPAIRSSAPCFGTPVQARRSGCPYCFQHMPLARSAAAGTKINQAPTKRQPGRSEIRPRHPLP